MNRKWMWKKTNRTKLHKKVIHDQKGMSLIEVIVAITILSVVAVSVLHVMTAAMLYNGRARIRQEVTLAAESMMESFKGYDLQTLRQMFESGSGLEGVTAGSYAAPSEEQIEAAVSPVTFQILDMETQNQQVYDVEIVVTPGAEQELLEITNMVPQEDAIFQGDRSSDKNVLQTTYQHFLEQAGEAFVEYMESGVTNDEGDVVETLNLSGDPITESDISSTYIALKERRTKITIYTDGDGNDVVCAEMVYTYRLENFPYYVKVYPEAPSDEYGEEEESTESNEVGFVGDISYLEYYPADGSCLEVTVPIHGEQQYQFYKNPRAAGLDRIFVYYYPQYESSLKDTVVFENMTDLSLSCYLLKQKAQDLSDTRTAIFESRYYPKVSASNSGGGSMLLYHNLDENIGNITQSVAGSDVSGFANGSGRGENYMTADTFRKNKVLSHQVTVTVRDKAGNLITQLESTMNEM